MLENSSYAVKPELFDDNAVEKELIFFKKLNRYEYNDNKFILIYDEGKVIFSFQREDIFRVEVSKDLNYQSRKSLAVENNYKIDFEYTDEDSILLKTSKIEININKEYFSYEVYRSNKSIYKQNALAFDKNSNEMFVFMPRNNNDYIYGLGEKTGFLNKNNTMTSMWNTDVFEPHNDNTQEMYQSINLFTYFNGFNAYGFFLDNPSRVHFDFKSNKDETVVYSEEGVIDYYIFVGPSKKNVLEQYTYITGRPYLPSKWQIGYHQSRHSYESSDKVREIIKNFKDKDIPIDTIFLDILYMDGYRVFTFNKDYYSDYKELIDELHSEGIRVVPIVDPGVKVDENYRTYNDGIENDYFCKYPNGEVFIGDVWPGKSAFPDFLNSEVSKWWGNNHKFYTDLGITGIWNDMNEPSVFCEDKTMDLNVLHNIDGKSYSHKEVHNIYGYAMSRATALGIKELTNQRPFVLTRAGYAGIQKYAAVWTGDNRSFWEHLEMTLPMCMNLGMSGVAFSGPDLGGFMNDSNGELLTRWTQIGTFLPYMRNHCSIGMINQEPWAFGDKYETIIKDYIKLRYKFLPYIYSLFKESNETGIPVMRPLVLEYPSDKNTYELFDQFMVGDSVLIAPIMRPGKVTRDVYLPKGKWYDYHTNELIDGDRYILVHAPLDKLPIFIKAGSIIPEAMDKNSTMEDDKVISFNIYPDDSNEINYEFYDDDGNTYDYQDGEYVKIKVQFDGKDAKVISIDGNYRYNYEIRFVVK